MRRPPAYFERIRAETVEHWELLEAKEWLAAPWRQLFKQVQSPRHVLSELLQNADDANATTASARIEGNRFVFWHDGEDFNEAQFQSLCRFGFSNKRSLHTIGFRGIGFKSTFSLGPRVQLRTPSLAVAFEKRRFTEPHWTTVGVTTNGRTEITVEIQDPHRLAEIDKNLKEWARNPVSLLFFRRIRKLIVGDDVVSWRYVDQGPVHNSSWMALEGNQSDRYLKIRSEEEAFPADAIQEIREERLVSEEQLTDLPPARVELVLSANGRLYVILPTGVETSLPFACNAPFVQDPARVKIKDPDTSPTNRWLLSRIGRVAGEAMCAWLENASLSIDERSRAYELLPSIDREATGLHASCETIVEIAFNAVLKDRPFVLTGEGQLASPVDAVALPREVLDVWPAEVAREFLYPQRCVTVSPLLSDRDLGKIARFGPIVRIQKTGVLDRLIAVNPPAPTSWAKLLQLWAYLAPELTNWATASKYSAARIVPAQGQANLQRAAEVVRLGDKRLLNSDADWEFLSEHLLVLNPNWPRFLAEERRNAEPDSELSSWVSAAIAVQQRMNLDQASELTTVVDRVAQKFFASSRPRSEIVRFAHIAAALDVGGVTALRWCTRDEAVRAAASGLIVLDGTLDGFLPEDWADSHATHPDYSRDFVSCSRDEWIRWIASGRSGLRRLPQLELQALTFRSPWALEEKLRELGYEGSFNYPYARRQYSTQVYGLEDYDFPEQLTRYWEAERISGDVWPIVAQMILESPDAFPRDVHQVRATQTSTNGGVPRGVTLSPPVMATWVRRFREQACLPDTRRVLRKPGELLRRTPATEPFMDIEPFIDVRLDTERNRPILDLIGVRDTPPDPSLVLVYLRSLSKSVTAPQNEVDKWYRRLDVMLDNSSTSEIAAIRTAFLEEPVVLSENGGWTTLDGVFLSSDDEDAPGAAVVRSSVRDLALWRRLGVADRPTVELAIQWLKALPTGDLSRENERRVSSLLKRHPIRIWEECGHWLNLSRQWVPVSELTWALTMQSLVEWSHLHENIKRRTADLRLSVEVTSAEQFRALRLLSTSIEERLDESRDGGLETRDAAWLVEVGSLLERVELDSDSDTQRVRALGARLAETRWIEHPSLHVIPYVDGLPAGTGRDADAVWLENELFVRPLKTARLARIVPDRIAREFGRQDVTAALSYCFGRPTRDVAEYMVANFSLGPIEVSPPIESIDAAAVGSSSETATAEPARSTGTGRGAPPIAVNHSEIDTAISPTANAVASQESLISEPAEKSNIPPRQGIQTRTQRAKLVDRFARLRGFHPAGDGGFVRDDGHRLRKEGGLFPWQEQNGRGVLRHYWFKDQSLSGEPIEVDAELWSLIEQFGDEYAIVVSDDGGEPMEFTGSRLRAMKQSGELLFYPATIRIALKRNAN